MGGVSTVADREPQPYDMYFDEIVAHCNEVADWFIARHRGDPLEDFHVEPKEQ